MAKGKPGFSKRAFKTQHGVKFFRWSRNGFRGGIKLKGPPYLPCWRAVTNDGREFTLYQHIVYSKRVLLETTPKAKGRWVVKSTTAAMARVMKEARS